VINIQLLLLLLLLDAGLLCIATVNHSLSLLHRGCAGSASDDFDGGHTRQAAVSAMEAVRLTPLLLLLPLPLNLRTEGHWLSQPPLLPDVRCRLLLPFPLLLLPQLLLPLPIHSSKRLPTARAGDAVLPCCQHFQAGGRVASAHPAPLG